MLAPPPEPAILVAEEGDEIAVTICPPQPIGHDRVFRGYLQAMAYARLIRLECGWKIVDRCDPATKRKAA